MLKISYLFVLTAGILSCSPVKFNAKSTGGGGGGNPDPVCEDESCVPINTGTTIWRTGEWGICSQSCGGGTQSRAVNCVNQANQPVPDDQCKEAKPSSTQACNTQACSGTNPVWNVGPWGACSATCGGGTQTRTVECRDATGVKPDNSCTEAKPATQQICNSQACACTGEDKTFNLTVSGDNNKVDILVVVDDSSSMGPDNLKLAERLSGFVTDLQTVNLDWQMCITTTDIGYYEGRPIQWSGTSTRIVNKTTPNLASIFQQTITDIGSGWGNDEQGVKASVLSMLNNPVYPCYRTNAALAVIIISDEDERSVGGNQSLSSQQYQPLTAQNYPATFVNTANAVFGAGKRLTVNSIVVRDNQCKMSQDPQGSPAFIGLKYMELANLTAGTIGNICDEDYSTNLKYFKDTILTTISNVELACVPVGTPVVTLPDGYTWAIQGNKITFTPALTSGVTLSVKYKCCP
jgi:hypothetical protein